MSERLRSISYPPDWEDEERMHFLLAPFPPSSVRTLSLSNQKVHFWRLLIHSVCRQLKKPTFTGKEMAQNLQWNGHSPTCLPQVLQLMEQSRDVQKFHPWEKGEGGGGWVRWGLGAVTSPVKWVWQSYMSQSDRECYETQYVDQALLKELAARVVEQFKATVEYQSTDQVVMRKDFCAVALQVVDPSSVAAVEQELVREGKMAQRVAANGLEVVKVTIGAQSTATSVSDTDEGILSLKEAIRTLQAHSQSMENRIKELKHRAMEHLHANQRQLALGCLRRGKKVESVLRGKEVMLDNLQHIMQQIQLAESDALVLKAYRSGTEALKNMHKKEKLTIEEAETTMVALYEAIQLNEEVSDALATGHPEDEEDQEELEKELEAILSPATSSGELKHREDETLEKLSALKLDDSSEKPSDHCHRKTDPLQVSSRDSRLAHHAPQLA